MQIEGFSNAVKRQHFNSNSSSAKTFGDDYTSKETRDRSYGTLDDNTQMCSNSPGIFIQQNNQIFSYKQQRD